MTSASSHPAAAVLNTDRVDATAERIAIDWAHHGHSVLTAMIAELYTDLADLPPRYTPDQRADILTDAADITATELMTMLDFVYQEADRPPVTEYGWGMHTDDRHTAVVAALTGRTASHLTWWLTDYLTDREAEDLD
ncbi:hypothetical protein A9W98_20740 [Mycobacterium gordonae]|uniref:Uncharacterized protein n=1 Tax=Mycobacterium gordonae TaxID=1778 RepID=A0A1A6BGE1_MYCGO|nr:MULTISPECIES: hypothetical protein [Mycobacterium]MBX9918540.1 hypothetical protein [Mycolicibacterium frederiksbergense]OBS01341.1 hypothetical protein A9W98_20740 [Mycobacterium gordonae]PJE00661.1 MAG: hypothetical protein CK428_32150 [Mycobacterium sp.]